MRATSTWTSPRREEGFTLIEILIVIFLLSLILAVAVPNYTKSTERAEKAICDNTKKGAEAQLELYLIDHKQDATKIMENGEIVLSKLVDEGYLKEAPQCPSNGKYRVGKGSDGTYQVKCSFHDEVSTH
ncbi:competence type IV pilus major pilin ComGC [Thermicanus aegyptius]|uniref:competence type IV pilus major pilin ComGC n=1 Tax=Thermicanus aegyptius TaxID=94009 RepID=UPI000426EDF2|nr:prepilin-type N-terminal cleavage/methylation domain-containing protein [Thermicanus aegyptius]